MAEMNRLALEVPKSRNEIARIQSERKRLAVERARTTPFWKPRLSHIRLDKLDDMDEWRKIPILQKEELRALTDEQFYTEFCRFDKSDVGEYWRSGGVTGRPLFYPRTHEDMKYALVGFARTFQAIGVQPGSVAHLSFPLGIHPAGQAWARAANLLDIGVLWAGSGTSTPSKLQLELVRSLKPDIWMGMSSYGLHLASLADAEGIDLAASTVKTILTTAEPVSATKRKKLEMSWGAEAFDHFGMTECSMIGAEGRKAEGFHIWTDLAFIEIVHPTTYAPVAPGEDGALLVTALYTNHATPFLRWFTGDIVRSLDEPLEDAGPLSVFPRIQHAHRTAGFFKVRGININHAELEDFMFADPRINDFRAEAVSAADGNDQLILYVEVRRGIDAQRTVDEIAEQVRGRFELRPRANVLPSGTIARDFESSIKAPRFTERRT
jgi:phenylacetate-CoA ligase